MSTPSMPAWRRRTLSLAIAALFAPPAWAVLPGELPTGGQVLQGQAAISQAGAALTVNQTSQNALLHWNTFNVGTQASVSFQQPNAAAIAVNRILDGNGSQVLGRLSANGQVFLINPNGVLFGEHAQVNVGGLVASTLDLSEADAGRFVFAGSGGRVENRGAISAGRILLLGGESLNSGTLTAPGGQIELAAAGHATLTLDGPQAFTLRLDSGVAQALTKNSGAIAAVNGVVRLSAKAVDAALGAVVNNEGVIEATGLSRIGGEIVLTAEEGYVIAGGELDASSSGGHGGRIRLAGDSVLQTGSAKADGTHGGDIDLQGDLLLHAGSLSARGSAGEGGHIALTATAQVLETRAALADVGGSAQGGQIAVVAGAGSAVLSGTLTASGRQGGRIVVTGDDLTLAAASLDARGTAAGGEILVGGDAHGANPAVANSTRVLVNDHSRLDASAGENGNGGKVVVWSESRSDFAGTARADAGAAGGDGGFIEISSRDRLGYAGTVSAAAPHGAKGRVLFDPKNVVVDAANPASGIGWLDLPPPATDFSSGNGYGGVLALSNGKIAVASNSNSSLASGLTTTGAVYLYDSSSGSLLSALYGGHNGDSIGSGNGPVNGSGNGLVAVGTRNFVVVSPNWNGYRGAVTYVDGNSGLSDVVSDTNSLVGSSAFDKVGGGTTGYAHVAGVKALSNGNYVVISPEWNGSRGAVTWGSGHSGVVGPVDAGNSLIGSTAGDSLGSSGVTALSYGNYVVLSTSWQEAVGTSVGAVTWGDGTLGSSGVVDAGNSFVGSSVNGRVGGGGVTALSNGNYVVGSPGANISGFSSSGAATLGNGANGEFAAGGGFGGLSTSNSLYGTASNDQVGSKLYALTNGNYVVTSTAWGNNRGAVTWGDGTAGTVGPVYLGNSLQGSLANDAVGTSVTPLNNGHYVVASPSWNGGRGAATWVNGSSGRTGNSSNTVSAFNSLVGSNAYSDTYGAWQDGVGSGGIVALSNGHYAVASPNWGSATFGKLGAVTWGNGSGGTVGAVASGNSLTGDQQNDRVGSSSITALLTNGNYVVSSATWHSTRGAVTWRDGSAAGSGVVGTGNSFVGSSSGDDVGNFGSTALLNGDYVAVSSNWINGTLSQAGAVTQGNGSTGQFSVAGGPGTLGSGFGAVDATNSLVGSHASDNVGIRSLTTSNGRGVVPVTTSTYVVVSENWHNGAVPANSGAVTYMDATNPAVGPITSANSLLGSASNHDRMGSGGVYVLSGGKFVVSSPSSAAHSVVVGAPGSGFTHPQPYSLNPDGDSLLRPAQLEAVLAAGTDVTLEANNDITFNSAVNVVVGAVPVGDLTLHAGRSVLLNANLSTGGGDFNVIANDTAAHGVQNLQREAGAAVIQMAAVSSINAGTGNVSLTLDTGAGNSDTTSGDITLQRIDAAAISVVNRGPTAGSDVVINTGGSLNGGTSGTIVVAANTGTFTNNAGASSLNPGAGGRYLIYSDDPATTSEGVTGYAKHYNQTYTTGTIPSYAASGNWFLYRVAPTLTATPSVGAGKQYDGDATTLGTVGAPGVVSPSLAGVAGLIDGDTLTLGASTYGTATPVGTSLSGSLGYSRAAGRNVGAYNLFADLTSSDAAALGYGLTQGTAANGFTISAKPLTVSGLTAANKQYNANPTTSLSGPAALVGVIDADLSSVSANASTATAAFRDNNVGTSKPVDVAGIGLSGTGAGNYSLTQPTLAANITAAPLTVTGLFANNRQYNADTDASLFGTAGLAGVFASDVGLVGVNATTATAAFRDKNVANAKPVDVAGISLTGDALGNYSLTQPTLEADITAAPLTLGGSFTANDKIYDGTTTASFKDNNLTLIGLAAGDSISGGFRLAFQDAAVGQDKPVVIIRARLGEEHTGPVLVGRTDSDNYQIDLTNAPAGTASITAGTSGGGGHAAATPVEPTPAEVAAARYLLSYFNGTLTRPPMPQPTPGADEPAADAGPAAPPTTPGGALPSLPGTAALYRINLGGIALPDGVAP